MQLGLGTVQFGLDYGISNSSGRVGPEEIQRILDYCSKTNIQLFDTASLYGKSEEVLGRTIASDGSVKIVTKLPPCAHLTGDEIDNSFAQSLRNLNTSQVYGLMLHSGADLLGPNGQEIYARLEKYKSQNRATKIGVSVYTPEETLKIIDRFEIDLVQLPVNVFDQRFIQSNVLQELKSRNVEIHARSTFLQGLLLMELSELPPYFAPFREHIEHYFKSRGNAPLVPAIQFVKKLNLVDYLIVGVTSQQELAQIVNAYQQDCHLDFSSFACSDEGLILPTNWTL